MYILPIEGSTMIDSGTLQRHKHGEQNNPRDDRFVTELY